MNTVGHQRRWVRVAIDAAGVAYVIAVYVTVLTRGRFYARWFHSTWGLHAAGSTSAAFFLALVGNVPVDIVAAILATVMVLRAERE